MEILHEATYYLGLATATFIGSGLIAGIVFVSSPLLLGIAVGSGMFGGGVYAACANKLSNE